MADKITVHDPRGFPPKVIGKRLAPRLESSKPLAPAEVDALIRSEIKRWREVLIKANIIRPEPEPAR